MSFNPIVSIIETVGGFFGKREERKQLEKTIDGKIAMQKQGGDHQITFNEQEIDMLAKRNEGKSWKDEYLTVIMTLPLIATFLGALFSTLFGNSLYMDAAVEANKAVKELVPNYQELLGLTIVAGLGLRAVKRT
jgi:hypothetical protein